MGSAKEIRTKIGSITNTRKITKAMEMVAASKMRKAQDRMQAARPFAEKMRNAIAHVANANSEYKHPYLQEREVKRVGLMVISTDRGLCGGLNVNMFRATLAFIKDLESKGIGFDVVTIGSKAAGFFNRIGGKVIASADHLGDSPHIQDLIGTVKVMLDAYTNGEIDQLHLVTNEFINTMTQKPIIRQLLPVQPGEDERLKHHWDYIYEPEAAEVMEHILTRYIESQAYQGMVENIACAQAARMVAMKSASDNAGDLIDELQLIYNKARQAAITQELSEIVSGAAAV